MCQKKMVPDYTFNGDFTSNPTLSGCKRRGSQGKGGLRGGGNVVLKEGVRRRIKRNPAGSKGEVTI